MSAGIIKARLFVLGILTLVAIRAVVNAQTVDKYRPVSRNDSVLEAADAKQYSVYIYLTDALADSVIGAGKVTILKHGIDTIPSTTRLAADQYRISFPMSKGIFTMWVEKDGYKPVCREINIKTTRTTVQYLGKIPMERLKVTNLGEVTVTPTRIKMVMRGDTIVYDASAFELAEGSMLDALVAQLPGTELHDGQIKVNGKFIEALLVNGEDFFSGNPTIALQNLPAYTVKSVRVYDRSQADAYLKGNLKTGTADNMVMDVQLKKQYSYGWMANITGGYGSHNRYLGKAFGLGYREGLRLAAFANINNISDTQTVGTEGKWQPGTTNDGELDHKEGGVDYLWEKRDFKLTGNACMRGERPYTLTRTSSVSYFDDGEVYTRKSSHDKQKYFWVWSANNLSWSGKNAYIEVKPAVSYLYQTSSILNREASFDKPVYERYSGELLDSLMLGKNLSGNSLMNFTHHLKGSEYNHFSAELAADATIGIPGTTDFIQAKAKFSTMYNHTLPDNLYSRQLFNLSDHDTKAISIYQHGDLKHRKNSGNAEIGYYWVKAIDIAARINAFIVAPQIAVDWNRDNNNNLLRQLIEDNPTLNMLPSTFEWAALPVNHPNTYTSTQISTSYIPQLLLQYERNSQREDGYTFLQTCITGRDRIHHDRLHYDTEGYNPNLGRTKSLPEAEVSLKLEENSTKRHFLTTAQYSYTRELPKMSYSLLTSDTSNPLVIYLNNPDLYITGTHKAVADLSLYDYNAARSLAIHLEGRKTNNAVAMCRYYNQDNGVYTYLPVNVNGNWDTSAKVNCTIPFGPNKSFSLSSTTSAGYVNSVDCATQTDNLMRSVVGNTVVGQKLYITYTKGKNTVGLKGDIDWRHAVSKQKLFSTINAWTYVVKGNFVLNLPFAWQLSSDLNLYLRRGYDDNSLNTSDWLWNAAISKSFLKGSVNATINAVDILGQASHVRNVINAQGRKETWCNSVPRFIMLNISYKFNVLPKK